MKDNIFEEDVKKLIVRETSTKHNVSIIFYKIFKDSPTAGRVLLVSKMGHTNKPKILQGISDPNENALFCINGFKWNKNNKGTAYYKGSKFDLIFHSDWGSSIDVYDYEVDKLIKNKKEWEVEYTLFEKPPKGYKLKYLS